MEKKREILEEKIKQALTSTYKVISDQLRYKKPNAKTTDIKSLDFSEIKDLKNKDDYVKLRASTDSKALKLRFSDSTIFSEYLIFFLAEALMFLARAAYFDFFLLALLLEL